MAWFSMILPRDQEYAYIYTYSKHDPRAAQLGWMGEMKKKKRNEGTTLSRCSARGHVRAPEAELNR